MNLSVVIPVYNEEECIEECIKEVKNVFDDDTEIVVVNDGSKDNTNTILSRILVHTPRIKYVFYEDNRGYSYAIREGFKNATKKFVTFIDADLQYHPLEVIKLYNYAIKNNSSFVIGEPENKYNSILRKLLSKGYNLYISTLLDLDLKDANSLKLMEKKYLDNINFSLDYGMIELETLLGFTLQGIEIDKHPIIVRERFAGKSKCSPKIVYRTLVDSLRLVSKKQNLIKK